jgi:hypothetical protein
MPPTMDWIVSSKIRTLNPWPVMRWYLGGLDGIRRAGPLWISSLKKRLWGACSVSVSVLFSPWRRRVQHQDAWLQDRSRTQQSWCLDLEPPVFRIWKLNFVSCIAAWADYDTSHTANVIKDIFPNCPSHTVSLLGIYAAKKIDDHMVSASPPITLFTWGTHMHPMPWNACFIGRTRDILHTLTSRVYLCAW